jgi:hypothetical protein
MRYCVTVVRMLLKLRVSVTWELHTLGLWLPQLVAAEERSRGWAFMGCGPSRLDAHFDVG